MAHALIGMAVRAAVCLAVLANASAASALQGGPPAGGPGTVVTNNLVYGNPIGLFLGQADRVSGNRMVDNTLFGLACSTGTSSSMALRSVAAEAGCGPLLRAPIPT